MSTKAGDKTMPRRDLITLDGDTKYGLNVFDTVGVRGANRPGDVMTIQAMFRYLGELWTKDGTGTMPFMYSLLIDPDGIIGHKTINAILAYQRTYVHKVLGVDGTIHPAKYENRKMSTRKPLMTITRMHDDLLNAQERGLDYTREIARRFPNVAFWIR
jgi:hypothetical protein